MFINEASHSAISPEYTQDDTKIRIGKHCPVMKRRKSSVFARRTGADAGELKAELMLVATVIVATAELKAEFKVEVVEDEVKAVDEVETKMVVAVNLLDVISFDKYNKSKDMS